MTALLFFGAASTDGCSASAGRDGNSNDYVLSTERLDTGSLGGGIAQEFDVDGACILDTTDNVAVLGGICEIAAPTGSDLILSGFSGDVAVVVDISFLSSKLIASESAVATCRISITIGGDSDNAIVLLVLLTFVSKVEIDVRDVVVPVVLSVENRVLSIIVLDAIVDGVVTSTTSSFDVTSSFDAVILNGLIGRYVD